MDSRARRKEPPSLRRRRRTEPRPSEQCSSTTQSRGSAPFFSSGDLRRTPTAKRTLGAGPCDLELPKTCREHQRLHAECQSSDYRDCSSGVCPTWLEIKGPRAVSSHRPESRSRADSCCFGVFQLLRGVLCLLAPVLAMACMAQHGIVRGKVGLGGWVSGWLVGEWVHDWGS